MQHEPQSGTVFKTEERGDRFRPGRFNSRYQHLTLLLNQLRAIINSSELKGETILDYGCGNKPYESLFKAKFANYLGADIAGNPQAEVEINAAGKLPLADGSVEAVLSSQVLEHVTDPRIYLEEAFRVLKPGGHLILSTHGYWKYHPDPHDFWRWTIEGLRVEIQRPGFEVVDMRGVFSLASTAVQLWQDATADYFPRRLRLLYYGMMQGVIGAIEFFNRQDVSNNASVFIVLARKPPMAHHGKHDENHP